MPSPSFLDHALSARLEAVEAAQLSALADTVAARLPAQGAARIEVGGGVAAFVGRRITVSRAAGLGMRGPVEAADIDALEHFYRSRETEARILVSPYADRSLFDQLGARGFALAGLDTTLVRRLDPAERFPTSEIEVTIAGRDAAAAWVAASLAGFGAPDDPPSSERARVFEAAFTVPGAVYFIASAGGVIAGTAALFVHDGIAYFFAASTRAAHRGRGVQAALIQARLAFARDAGVRLASTGTAPGSASQRNFERFGFAPVYSQALLIKRYDDP